ncbi:carboxypeptidase-like regulatory domain-containing protein [Aureibaculum sp. A20]|uniref:Carboxypeptidase-like regulatory domain-containing protein n=1 Tax=Aureibaculum flavum TaxID=2795986 RepID=A0ABS0WLC4_9FLAO|nr:carboxypeptidase-like regulatory domain-containing protein [Aureibaculum flavum]MBJ2172777.1 carboxypeptidase-like regulatory domain-containing protein [Aureibaculum flavum]
MNQNFNLSISKPCSENFNQFKKTEAGGFCDSCEKEVIDFRSMTPKEITNYFKNNDGKTCGIFNTPQLKTYTPEPIRNSSKFNFISGLSFSLLSMALMNTAQAQTTKQPSIVIEQNTDQTNNETKQDKEYTISGIISDESSPLPGANVVLQGTMVGTQTDFDGKFTFPQKLKKGDVLVISYIGYNSKHITITNNSKKLDFKIDLALEMDSCMILGEVEVQKVQKSKKSLWRKLKQ